MKTFSHLIQLTQAEVDYLNAADFMPASLLALLRRVESNADTTASLQVPRTASEEFRAVFTERLAKVGFDEAYELTAEGKLLEELIDRFHTSS